MSIGAYGKQKHKNGLKNTPPFPFFVAIIYNYVNKKQSRRDAFGVRSWSLDLQRSRIGAPFRPAAAPYIGGSEHATRGMRFI